jgi:hypothetical protein
MDATQVMDTTPVDALTAAAIEAVEARAWADLYTAAPPRFAAQGGVGARWVDGAVVLSWAATGRRYFSRAIGLGVGAPATPAALDDILGGWERDGISMFLLQSLTHCQPAEYEGWLRERGLEPFDAQDRILRGAAPLEVPPAPEDRTIEVERVERASADEWAEFIQRVYRLDTGRWLQALVGRPGWHHYVAREGGALVGARSMHIGDERMAWLGIDGPVPDVMTQDHEPDTALCGAIVRDGLAAGTRGFLADIEAPSATQDTPAYERFARLGFTRPYVRTHYARL